MYPCWSPYQNVGVSVELSIHELKTKLQGDGSTYSIHWCVSGLNRATRPACCCPSQMSPFRSASAEYRFTYGLGGAYSSRAPVRGSYFASFRPPTQMLPSASKLPRPRPPAVSRT